MTNPSIEALSTEDRKFPSPDAFAQQALFKESVYEEAKDLEKFWGAQAEQVKWRKPHDQVLDWSDARRSPSGSWAAPSTSPRAASTGTSRRAGDKVAYHWEGEPGDTRDLTYRELYDEVCRAANALQVAGRGEGRPGRHLHGHGPRAAHRHAGLRPPRRRPLRRLRRASPPTRCGTASTTPRPRCSSPATAPGAAGRWCRSSRWPTPPWPRRPRCEKVLVVKRDRGRRASMAEGRDVWWHDLVPGQEAECPASRGRRRAHALHPLHVGHDGQAQGHRAHHRRLRGGHLAHPPVRLRPAATTTSTGARPTSAG